MLPEILVAAVAGLLESFVCQWFGKRRINRIFTDIVAACLCTLWALGVSRLVPMLDVNTATIGALMVLTPGVALTMGIRDIINADYLSGAIRLLDAVLIAGSIACGVVLAWLAARGLGRLYGNAAVDRLPAPVPGGHCGHHQFQRHLPVSPRHYLASGLTGAVGWLVYILCAELLAMSAPVATLVAALPLTACARFFAIRHKAPITLFLLCGIFPLVPRCGIYYTAYYFLRDDRTLFANKGVETLKIAWLWPWALPWYAVFR